MKPEFESLRDRAREHQADLEAQEPKPRRASEFFAPEEAAAFVGLSVEQLQRLVPATWFPSPRNPRWSKEDLISLETAEGECHVYAIRRPDTHEIKIGISLNPLRRLRGLQANHGRKLELLLAYPGTVLDEVALHDRFKAYRLQGEWFDEAPEISTWIAEKTKKCGFVPPVVLRNPSNGNEPLSTPLVPVPVRPSVTCNSQLSESSADSSRPRKARLTGGVKKAYLAALAWLFGEVPQERSAPFPSPHVHSRFSPEGQADLERAAREELRSYCFRRGS